MKTQTVLCDVFACEKEGERSSLVINEKLTVTSAGLGKQRRLAELRNILEIQLYRMLK